MSKENYFSVYGPNIVHENFDDEMVVVNLETGCYYAFNLVGGMIWSCVETGCRLDALCRFLRASLAGEMDDLEQAVKRFIDELSSEELIRTGVDPSGSEEHALAETEDNEKQLFVAPALEKFTDMQDLLLLDPIHEVDESGWPHPMGGDNPQE
ncbi:MAG: PqqD family protein [Deltaproteobacteria bacterium]|nr:PqqD family protein [Deltaproteobacteria bacterium]